MFTIEIEKESVDAQMIRGELVDEVHSWICPLCSDTVSTYQGTVDFIVSMANTHMVGIHKAAMNHLNTIFKDREPVRGYIKGRRF